MNRCVTITIKDLRTINKIKYKMEIYCNNKILKETYIIDKYEFTANTNNIYTVKIYTKDGIKIGVIKHNNTLDFILSDCIIDKRNKVNILLTDYNYLKNIIERGTLYLWPNRIQ